ncbi:MAG: hypothetical protein N2450_03005 [bacterium]|nr:hypothetical protein [bacterium]
MKSETTLFRLNDELQVITRHICLTKDIGVDDNLFGGVMLSWIDEAAVIYAMLVTKSNRLVTRVFNNAEFQQPVKVGDVVEFLANGYKIGKTSITVSLRVVILDVQSEQRYEAHSVDVTLVQIDRNRKPLEIKIHSKP